MKPLAVPPQTGTEHRLIEAAEAVAAIAAAAADDVDQKARFPQEALAALRQHRMLGIMLPVQLGGEGASMGDIVDICYRLGQACASTAMIYAMHQSCVACVLRHGEGNDWHDEFLRRVAAEQLLLASSTTEGNAGGNVRASAAPIETTATGISLHRAATVVSYGAEADAMAFDGKKSIRFHSTLRLLVED